MLRESGLPVPGGPSRRKHSAAGVDLVRRHRRLGEVHDPGESVPVPHALADRASRCPFGATRRALGFLREEDADEDRRAPGRGGELGASIGTLPGSTAQG